MQCNLWLKYHDMPDNILKDALLAFLVSHNPCMHFNSFQKCVCLTSERRHEYTCLSKISPCKKPVLISLDLEIYLIGNHKNLLQAYIGTTFHVAYFDISKAFCYKFCLNFFHEIHCTN